MKIPHFKLEEFWKAHEFKDPYIFCSSNTEAWTLSEILAMADAESQHLWDTLSLGYTESPGHPVLREEIAKLYSTLSKEHILSMAGAEEGIYCLMQTLIAPSDHVIIVTPCYQSLESIPRALGADVTAIALKAENRWQLDAESLKKAFRPNTKLLVLNYPHNPTGMLLKEEVLQTAITLARQSRAYIFSDEVYRYLEIDPSKQLPALADAYEKGVSLNVMTKSFGLAGLRIGWLASQDVKLLEDVNSYKLYTSICNSAPSEILALIALRAKDTILKRNREIMLKNLELLDRFFQRHSSSFSWTRPESGPIAVGELLMPIRIEQFAEIAQESGILMLPGSYFNFPGNFFRIGFGLKNMPEVLTRFEKFVTSHSQI